MMRFWERNALWLLIGSWACVTLTKADGYHPQAPYSYPLLVWTTAKGISLMLSCWFFYEWFERRFHQVALWGPVARRWFSHFALAFWFPFYVYTEWLEALREIASLIIGIASAIYLSRLVWHDVARVRRSSTILVV